MLKKLIRFFLVKTSKPRLISKKKLCNKNHQINDSIFRSTQIIAIEQYF